MIQVKLKKKLNWKSSINSKKDFDKVWKKQSIGMKIIQTKLKKKTISMYKFALNFFIIFKIN